MTLTGRPIMSWSLVMIGRRTMANEASTAGTGRHNPWRIVGWGTAAALLLLPLVAMQFTSEVNWPRPTSPSPGR